MASKHFEGHLVEPLGDDADNDKLRFTHSVSTGNTLAGAQSIITIGSDGFYSFDLEYGIILIEYFNENSRRWIIQGSVTVNSDTVATDLLSLLGAVTPATPALVLQLEAILADANTAADNAAQSALDAANSAVENGELIKAILIAQGLSGEYGFFADGFTLNDPLDVGIDASYQFWVYVGAETLPYLVPAGTIPSATDYEQVSFNSASNVNNENGGTVQDFIDSLNTTVAEVATGKYVSGLTVTITDRADGEFKIESGGTPNGCNILDAGNGNTAVYQIKGNSINAEHCGIKPSDNTVRAQNNQCFDIIKTLQCKEITFPSEEYYFSKGLMMQTDLHNKAIIGRNGNSPTKFYYNGVIIRNIPTARLDSLSASASLLPENEPNQDNTALCFGTKTTQVGRAQFENIRLINDSDPNTYTDKTKRVGTGFFINSGWLDYDRVITDGWHVGSYELSFTTSRAQCEHIGFNIGFVYISGTSSDLSAMFANGTNYDTGASSYTVTYTPSEINELQGIGFVFGPLYYSDFSSLAADKIQRGYAAIGNENSYRTHLNFNGCGCEFVETDFYIDAPNTSILLNGGQDWGVSEVNNVEIIYVKNRRFPYNMASDLSASKIVQDTQTFKLQNPAELENQESCLPLNVGYNGLNYQRVKVDSNFKYWRITGRLEVNEFKMRIFVNLNGNVSGSLIFNYLSGNDATEFANSFGVVRVNTNRQAATSRRQVSIDAALNVTASVVGDYYEIAKPALSAGNKVSVDVDLIIKTSFTTDFTRKSTRPDFVTFLGVDF